ncbi:hypothetical protein [Sphingomonas sp. MMS24-J13]|uniref:hypothetical protein n=1 Tax=Sphingomonas sp. MMS24-J13 TaxID=3238686 RepID=UPI00384E5A26
MGKDFRALAALIEAEWLSDMFERFALRAVERRLAYSIDRQRFDDAMFFLDVYSFVNGGDILPGWPPSTGTVSGRLRHPSSPA